MWRAAVPKEAVVQHGAALTLVGGDKLTQQITPLPNWASPPPKALKTAIITATGASTVKWESQGPLGPAITLKFEAVQPFMARGKSVKLYLGYKQVVLFPTPYSSCSELTFNLSTLCRGPVVTQPLQCLSNPKPFSLPRGGL